MLLCLFFFNACGAKAPESTESSHADIAVKNIAILPIVAVAEKSESFTHSQFKNQERGVEVLTEIAHNFFSDYDNITILNDEKVDSFEIDYSANRDDQARSIAKSLRADAVMTINLNRYIERAGGKYSVRQPASVSFDYRLIQTETGQTLCLGGFDETQKSLTDNILSFQTVFKRKLQWITAEELARDAMVEAFGTCEYLKKPETVY
jgi:hypothetical protein